MPNQEASAATEPMTDREAAAQVRVEVALACIEDAQRLLDRAGEALCSVNGLAAQWRRVGTLYEQVKRAWYAIDGKSAGLRFQGRLTLDHEPDAHEEKWRGLSRERRS